MSDGKQPPKKKRRWLKWVGRVLLGLLALIVLAIGYLHTESGQNRIRATIEESLGAGMNGTAKLERLHFALFGQVEIGGLHLNDEKGDEVVGLDTFRVVPSWRDLIFGRVAIDKVEIAGVRLHIVNDASGASNLDKLFKPGPPPPPPEKPSNKLFELRSLSIHDVDVRIEEPDGTKVRVSDVGVEANASIIPADNTVKLEVEKLGVGLSIDKGAGALKLAVKDFSSGVSVGLDHGAGKVTLHPTHATVLVTPPGQSEKTIPVSLDAVTMDVDEAKIHATLAGLVAGALALASVDAAGPQEGKPGDKRADAVGLHVDAKKVNALLGRDVLASDADIELHVNGQGDDVILAATAKTAGGTLKLDGKVKPDEVTPVYDVNLSIDGVATSKLLVDGATKVPPVEVGHVGLNVRGQGRSRSTLKAVAKLRVEHVRARGVPIDAVTVDAHVEKGVLTVDAIDVEAIGQHANVTGNADLVGNTFDVALDVEGDAGVAMAALKAAGVPVKNALPKGAVALRRGDMKIHAKGTVGGDINVDVDSPRGVSVFGGRVGIGAHAVIGAKDKNAPPEAPPPVRDASATVNVSGIRLSSIAAARGKDLPVDGTLSGHVAVDGDAKAPGAKFSFDLKDLRAGLLPIDVGVRVNGRANQRDAHLTVEAKRGGENGATLAAIAVDAPLAATPEGKGLDPSRPIYAKVDIPRRTFAELADVLPLPGAIKNRIPQGEIAMTLDVHGSAARPDGMLDLDLKGHYLGDVEQRLHVAGTISNGSKADFDINAWLDDGGAAALVGKIGASFSAATKNVAWTADLDLVPQHLDSIPLPKERADKIHALGGEAKAHVALHGSANDVAGDVHIDAKGVRPTQRGAVGATFVATIADSRTSVDGSVDLEGAPLLKIAAGAPLGGKGLLAKARAHEDLDAPIDGSIEIPKRPISSLGALREALEKLPGVLEGKIALSGTTKAPLAKGRISASGFETLDGHDGGANIDLDAGQELLAVNAALGAGGGIKIDAHTPRAAVLAMGEGKPVPIDANIAASAVDLRSVVPKMALGGRQIGIEGRLDSTLAVHAVIAKKDGAVGVVEGGPSGRFDLSGGRIMLPGTSRTYHDVGVHIACDGESVNDLAIVASESDVEQKARTLSIKGKVGLEKLKPGHADAKLHADKWLLFGTKNIGQPDAPRGTLSLDAHVGADLGEPVKRVQVDVKHLAALFPDRFEKAHQPEDVHVGDLFFVGDKDTPGIGKLPVPASIKEAAEKAKVATAEPEPAEEEEEKGLDATIVIDGARVLQSPIDISPRGTLSIKSRKSGRTIRGRLETVKGELSLGGKMHTLEKGSFVFDDQHPEGYLDLTFARHVPDSAVRDVAVAQTGDAIRIHMTGPLSDRKTVLSGAGSPGTLYDLLAMHNTGHLRFMSEPGMPASETAQYPDFDHVLALSFISVNLPHLLFLDRAEAWANPYDEENGKSYGRLEHYEAERSFSGGSGRVRARNQPPRLGGSQSELELDWMLAHGPRTSVGVGVTGGSRGGGGPSLFWEWSSSD